MCVCCNLSCSDADHYQQTNILIRSLNPGSLGQTLPTAFAECGQNQNTLILKKTVNMGGKALIHHSSFFSKMNHVYDLFHPCTTIIHETLAADRYYYCSNGCH